MEKVMKRFVEGEYRFQSTLFPDALDDYITEDNHVRDSFSTHSSFKRLDFNQLWI
jgi:hypothetical protein